MIVRVFFYTYNNNNNNNNNNTSGTVASLTDAIAHVFLAADVGGTPRSRADSAHKGKGAPFVQSGGSSPQIGTPPRRVGVAPPSVGLSNEGRPGNRAMAPTNETPPLCEGWSA